MKAIFFISTKSNFPELLISDHLSKMTILEKILIKSRLNQVSVKRCIWNPSQLYTSRKPSLFIIPIKVAYKRFHRNRSILKAQISVIELDIQHISGTNRGFLSCSTNDDILYIACSGQLNFTKPELSKRPFLFKDLPWRNPFESAPSQTLCW